jgi:hypothetical protein
MNTMFVILAAVLCFALGTATLIRAAHASRVYDQGGDRRPRQTVTDG